MNSWAVVHTEYQPFECIAWRNYSSFIVRIRPYICRPVCLLSTPLCLVWQSLNSIISSLENRKCMALHGQVRLNGRCSSPSEPPATWWRVWALKICPSAVPVSHLVSIHPLPLSHPLFPSLSAHSADKVLDSLHFFSLYKKIQQLKSVLQNQCHPHIWWFQSQLDSNSLTAAVVDAVVSTSAVKLRADLWRVRREAFCVLDL